MGQIMLLANTRVNHITPEIAQHKHWEVNTGNVGVMESLKRDSDYSNL